MANTAILTTSPALFVERIAFDAMHIHAASSAVVRVHAVNASQTAWSIQTITPGFERSYGLHLRITRERAIEIGRAQAQRALAHAEAAARNARQAAYIQHAIDAADDRRRAAEHPAATATAL